MGFFVYNVGEGVVHNGDFILFGQLVNMSLLYAHNQKSNVNKNIATCMSLCIHAYDMVLNFTLCWGCGTLCFICWGGGGGGCGGLHFMKPLSN